MANFNKVILVGNLTRDPQLTFLPSNTPVVEFGLAINRRRRGQDGEMREETCCIDCRAYAKPAETINQYMSKGGPLLVEGRLQFQQWTAKDGSKRSKHVVVVEQFQFLGGGRRAEEGGAGRPEPRQAEPQPVDSAEMSQSDAEPSVRAEGDIPF